MKKKLLAITISGAAAFTGLAGCAGGNDTVSVANTETVSTTAAAAQSEQTSAKASASSSLEKTKFNIGHLNSTAHLLAFVAKEEGYFEDEGLDAELTQFSNATELAAGLENDKLDAALIGSFSTINLQSNGHDLTIFGGAMTNGHGVVIKPEFTNGESDRDNIELLKGHSVAVAKNSTDDLQLQLLLKNNNIATGEGEDQVNIVYFDSQKDAYAALANETIDACSVYSPYASLAKDQGYEVVYYDVDFDEFANFPCCRQVATTAQLAESPNAYKAFERAMIKAYKFYQENKEETIDDVSKYIDIDKDLIDIEVYGGFSTSSPDPDRDATIGVKNSAVEAGFTQDYDIESLYNTDIYADALEQVLSENPGDAIYQKLDEHFTQYQ